MSTSDRVSASARIAAPAARVYGIIADYRAGHPRIVPPRWFGPLEVERGGVGAGTIVRFTMKAFGRTQHLRAEVSEPEPGRVLVESYPESATTTTFTVERENSAPGKGGDDAEACVVTITTELPRKPGLFSRLENFFGRLYLKRVYAEELELLRAVVTASTVGARDVRSRPSQRPQ